LGIQTITARTDYKNLILSGTTPKSINGPTVVSGTVTLNQTTPATAVTLNGDLTVNGILSFVSGTITTASQTLTIGPSATITGASQLTGWVVGNLKKMTASNQSPSFTYAIGDATNYTPLELTFNGNTAAPGGLTARINSGDHPQIGSSGLTTAKSVNKTWTLINDALVGFSTYSAAFTYANADIDVSSTTSNFKVGLFSSTTWTILNTLVTPAPAPLFTTTATGISNFGDFAIGEPSSAVVNLTLFIEGYYIGGNLMNMVKNNQDGLAPITDVENITVELHNTTTPFETIATTNAILQTNGAATCVFPTAPNGSFYIVVKTVNAIQTWSKFPQTIGSTPLNYDFSTAASQAFGDNQIELEEGVFGFYSGDINDGVAQDGNIDSADYSIWEADNNNFAFGTFATDLNGDGNVDAGDYSIWEANNNNFIFATLPDTP
jgi:hypothetical protein